MQFKQPLYIFSSTITRGAGSEILHYLYVIEINYKFGPKLVRVNMNLVAERRIAAEVEDDVSVIGDIFCFLF